MSHRNWGDIPTNQRQALYVRFLKGAQIHILAEEVGLPPQTVERRLREMRQNEGKSTRKQKIRVETPTLSQQQPAIPSGKTLVVANPTDAHGVYCDPYAWELALKCIQGMQPDHITWGNDAMDFGDLSSYAKVGPSPSIAAELKDEKKRRSELLSAAPSAQIWWLSDNHTMERYTRYLYTQAPALAEVEELSLHNLLGIREDQMLESFDAGETLRIIHGTVVRKFPGMSVVAEIFDNPSNRTGRQVRSIMMGHVHRFAHVVFDHGIEGLESGCLSHLRPDYVKHARHHTNWAHGLGFARYGQTWSQILPAPFLTLGGQLVCRLEGQEYRVKLGPSYSGFC